MEQRKAAVGIYTLGCKVNQYESEAIAEALTARGYQIVPVTQICDAYIINTCTVTAESDRKARQFIRRAIHKNPQAYILVTGCLSQSDPDQVAAIAGVDYICGNAEKLSVVEAMERLLTGGKKPDIPTVIRSAPDSKGFEAMQINRFSRTRAYVKIEDGCENHCAYCIIPRARGAVRSKPPMDVIREVTALTAGGCREVVLTGIETASYGKDLSECSLGGLLEQVDRIPGIGRVRLGSLDPSLMKEDFVQKIARLSSLTPHFHLSMQSGCDKTLAAMKRKYNTRMALEAMERVRRAIPEVQFTTDMIVGFPGESEADFTETLAFVQNAGFLMIHVFPYSRRRGTVADQMPNQVPEEIKHQRVARLSEAATRVRREILAGMVGKTLSVLPETFTKGHMTGHTAHFIEVEYPLSCPGRRELTAVTITDFDDHRLYGEVAEKP